MLDQIQLAGVTLLLNDINVADILRQLMPELQLTLDRLNLTIANLRVDIEVLQNKLQDCETFDRNIHADFELMESGIDADHKRIIAAEASIGKLNKSTDRIECAIGNLEDKTDSIESDLEDLSGRVDSIESDTNDLEHRLDDSDATLEGCNPDSIADDIKADVEVKLEGIEQGMNNLREMILNRDMTLEHILAFQGRIKMAVNAS